MSNKIKKRTEPMSFSANRWFGKISGIRPPTFVISLIIITAAIILLGGGLYDIATGPPTYVYINQKFYFLVNRYLTSSPIGDQFTSETAITAILYGFGFIGLMTLYQSSKHAYNPRQAHLMLIVGVTLLLIAYIFLEAVLGLKFTTT
jgi:hypothetical protein